MHAPLDSIIRAEWRGLGSLGDIAEALLAHAKIEPGIFGVEDLMPKTLYLGVCLLLAAAGLAVGSRMGGSSCMPTVTLPAARAKPGSITRMRSIA